MDNYSELGIVKSKKYGDIRFLMVNKTLYFCGLDVGKALGYKSPSKVINSHCVEQVKKRVPMLGSTDKFTITNFITKKDLSILVDASIFDNSKEFESWILEEASSCLKKETTKNKKKEEGKNMNFMNKMGKMFGTTGVIDTEDLQLSAMGIAIKNNQGGFNVYNKEEKTLIDACGMTFDMPDMFMAFPTSELKVGDLIQQNDAFFYIEELMENKAKVINPSDGLEQTLLLRKTPFGFNFHTKIFSLMDMMGGKSGSIGGMNPMMMMMALGGSKGDGEKSNPMLDMMPMMMMGSMGGGGNPFGNMFGEQNMDKNQGIDLNKNDIIIPPLTEEEEIDEQIKELEKQKRLMDKKAKLEKLQEDVNKK